MRVLLPVQGGFLCGPQNPLGSMRQGIILRRQKESLFKRDRSDKTVILPGCQTTTSAPCVQRCSRCAAVACVCLCVNMCARLRCASTKLRRINAAFTDSRKLCERMSIVNQPAILYISDTPVFEIPPKGREIQ